MKIHCLVNKTPAAAPETALRHFEGRLTFETDCWDVHFSLNNGSAEFVLLDVRSREMFDAGHVPRAVSLPHPKLNESSISEHPANTLFVVYCAGPHCNGANKAAIQLAKMGRPVKEMIGGIEGWKDEGFELAQPAHND